MIGAYSMLKMSIIVLCSVLLIWTTSPNIAHGLGLSGFIQTDDMLRICERTLGGQAFSAQLRTYTTPWPKRSLFPSENMIAWDCFMDYGETIVIVQNVASYCKEFGYSTVYAHAHSVRMGPFKFKVSYLFQCI